MKLVIGGYAQGKLDYVLKNERDCLVWDGRIPLHADSTVPEHADRVLPMQEDGPGKTIVVNGFHRWVRETLKNGGDPEAETAAFVKAHPSCIIISDEIGNGVVPIDSFEREYRERTWHLYLCQKTLRKSKTRLC